MIDLKPDNVLLEVESEAVIEDLVQQERKNPSPYKSSGGRAIYPSRNFGDLKSAPGLPKIADFGLAVAGDVSVLHTHPIQPDLFQAPEVILQAGWTYSADIWNLGVMVSTEKPQPCRTNANVSCLKLWDLVENDTLFDATDLVTNTYSAGRHLEEMTAFFGPPPKSLIERAKLGATYFTKEGLFI